MYKSQIFYYTFTMNNVSLPVSFEATVVKSPKKGGWTYFVWPESAVFFGTRGLAKVQGTFDGEPFESSFMALGDGTHKLPVTGAVLSKISKSVGDTVHIVITDRR
jgi:hypothetical protein